MCKECLPKNELDEFDDLDGIDSLTRSYWKSINSEGDI